MQLILLGINHKTAPLAMREKVAFSLEETGQALGWFKSAPNIHEVFLLSTCNRTEIYALVDQLEPGRESLVRFLIHFKALGPDQLKDLCYTYYNKFAAEHLFQVAAGLDSMILGESEILKQLKDAWKTAGAIQATGTILNALVQYAIRAGKRIRTETALSQKPASIGAVATRLVKEFLQSRDSTATILLIGLGKIGETIVKNLYQNSNARLIMANRSLEKARRLAERWEVTQVISLDEIPAVLPQADVVIACTAAPHYLLDASQRELFRPDAFLLDLSVPRNIDPALGQQAGITLHDLDRLQTQAHLNQQERSQFIAEAETILADEMARFLEWFNSLDVVPTIEALYQLFDQIREQEIQRGIQKYQGELDQETRDLLDRVTRAVTQKILHYPVVQLKVTKAPPQKQHYLQALSDLFKLDTEDYIDRYLHQQRQVKATAPLERPS